MTETADHTMVVPAVPSTASTAATDSDRLRITTGSWRQLTEGSAAVWLGLVIVTAGFLVIMRAWVKVAGLLDVALQMPYLISGGLIGIGLIIVGVAFVDVAVRRRDAAERRDQISELRELLVELRRGLEDDQ